MYNNTKISDAIIKVHFVHTLVTNICYNYPRFVYKTHIG